MKATRIGVRFLPLDSEQAEYLTMFLRYLDDDTSRRRPDGQDVDRRSVRLNGRSPGIAGHRRSGRGRFDPSLREDELRE